MEISRKPHPGPTPPPTRQDFAPQDPLAHRRWRRRLRLIQLGLLVFFVAVSLRLVQVQIIESEKFTKLANRQYQKKKDRPALRGSMLDRNNSPIVTGTSYVSIEVTPANVDGDSIVLARTLARITGKSPRHYLSLINQRKKGAPRPKKDRTPVRLTSAKKPKNPKEAAKERKRNMLPWVMLEKSLEPGPVFDGGLDTINGVTINWHSGRVHHVSFVAGQLLGATDSDDRGIAGLELGYDTLLRGSDGYIVCQVDALGDLYPVVDYPRVDPVNGASLELTLDIRYQEIAENELEKGIGLTGAEGGIVVMLDPKTGGVLAAAQYPSVSPEKFGKAPKEDQKLRAVTDMAEPGSVFKVVTAAAALENGVVSPDKSFNAENGVWNVYDKGRRAPRRITDVHKFKNLTFREAIEHSSNIVVAKISNLLGRELLYRTARDFGFGMPTGVDFPGEIGGSLRNPTAWTAPDLNTLAYGYGVGVTPLQVAAAYAAVANGGVMMRPYVLKRVIGPDGTTVRETVPAPVRRVVSAETAAMLTSFFEGVVERGTGTAAKIEGIRVAGKTGTSKRLVDGRYAASDYTASFVGYFPADDPSVVCLVMLDKPKGVSRYGGTTSAPIFKEIVRRILSSDEEFARPANLPVAAIPAAAGGTAARDAGRGKQAARDGRSGSKDGAAQESPRYLVPDLRGYSLREALNVLRDEKFQPRVSGSGVVISQTPEPGEPVSGDRIIWLNCLPRNAGQGGGR